LPVEYLKTVNTGRNREKMPGTCRESAALFDTAKIHIPGGVNSPVRAFKAVGGTPVYVKSGKGPRIYDEDGNEYIDFLGSWGPLILGHAHPVVQEAAISAIKAGTSFGTPHAGEIEIASLIKSFFPSIELVRLVNSGTEAAMSAIRVARGYTGRNKIIKFEGCYHGHADALLTRAGSGAMTFDLPDSMGVPPSMTEHTLTVPYNDTSAVIQKVNEWKDDLAAIIVEPVAGNMGVIPPAEGFLQCLKDLTLQSGGLLIFDEVITGFRVAPGGAAERYAISPDITVLGKILGGGFPIGAYGGKREIMEFVAPSGGVYQAGTLSGNPVAVAAGSATLKILQGDESIHESLEKKGATIEKELSLLLSQKGLAHRINRAGSMFTLFFTDGPVIDYVTAKKSDTALYGRFFHKALEEGIYMAPSQFEAAFISTAHRDDDLEVALQAFARALADL